MRAFARLVGELERTRRREPRLAALVDYFRSAAPADAAWAAFFLSGRRAGRVATSRRLLEWAGRAEAVPGWLLDLSYAKVGDLAETAALLVRGDVDVAPPLHVVAERSLEGTITESTAVETWRSLGPDERFVWNKLASGTFRPGVSRQLVARAIAEAAGVAADAVAHRLEQSWEPTVEAFERLVRAEVEDAGESRPYPCATVEALDDDPSALGDPSLWVAEWKLDGHRAQLVRRGGRTYVWSRDELVTERFPEVADAARAVPDGTVLDGELVAIRDRMTLPSAEVARRDGRNRLTKKVLQESPVAMVVFDCLEHDGRDLRDEPLDVRRQALEAVVDRLPGAAAERLPLSAANVVASWAELERRRADARSRRAEGLVVKRRDAAYGAPGAWRSWRVEPLAVLAILLYIERGGSTPDLTFAVWADDDLVPVAKTADGLSESELRRVDRFARLHTEETFGPVRRVRPTEVFELAFDAVEPAPRRKAGLVLRSPRIVKWLRDASPDDAATLAELRGRLDRGDE